MSPTVAQIFAYREMINSREKASFIKSNYHYAI